MTADFLDHLNATRTGGEYDLDRATKSLATEIEANLLTNPSARAEVARLAAQRKRNKWSRQSSASLRKQFEQGQMSFDLGAADLSVKVPLGDNVVVDLGEMNEQRIRRRRELRLSTHRDEMRAFEAEMAWWDQVLGHLKPNATLKESLS